MNGAIAEHQLALAMRPPVGHLADIHDAVTDAELGLARVCARGASSGFELTNEAISALDGLLPADVALLPEHDAAALAWDPCRHLPLVTRRLWLRPVAAVPNDDGGQTERDDLLRLD